MVEMCIDSVYSTRIRRSLSEAASIGASLSTASCACYEVSRRMSSSVYSFETVDEPELAPPSALVEVIMILKFFFYWS
jgi:hypothetical protein